jgi:putative DNA primase/helicase
MLDRTPIGERAIGRWPGILGAMGVSANYLTGKNTGCPLCKEGKDRFKFDDKQGRGTWICTRCGAGDGVKFVMLYMNVPFVDARKEIEKYIGAVPVVAPKAAPNDEVQRAKMTELWRIGRPLNGQDIASRYLTARGIDLDPWPAALRWVNPLSYWHEDKSRADHLGMLAKFSAPDGKPSILHRTYLSEPGEKAQVPKPKMITPGKVAVGGAVRLGAAAETMGIGEGIETCLSASIIFGIPVWCALAANYMMRWEPPPEAKNVIIFGDRDDNFVGQVAAYNLAQRLKGIGLNVEVRLPDAEEGADFNDVLLSRGKQ